MPVTFKVASQDASKLPAKKDYHPTEKTLYTDLSLENNFLPSDKLYISSLSSYQPPIQIEPASQLSSDNSSASTPFPLSKITATDQSGFVLTALTAYNYHQNLIIRPDDVWIAVISQFALFLGNESHSEALRHWIIASKDRKAMVVKCDTVSDMPTAFRNKLEEVVVNKTLEPWITPDFSTTTEQDKEVASFLLMGSLKNFHTYTGRLNCGIPSVTLLGERMDYVEIFLRMEYLVEFDHPDLTAWAKLLRVVFRKAFLDAFDMREDGSAREKVVETWSKICHHECDGSGQCFISGWIVAFSYFGGNGMPVMRGQREISKHQGQHNLKAEVGLLGTEHQFGRVEVGDVAPGFAEVDIKVVGDLDGGEVHTTVVAGSIGMGQGILENTEKGVKLRVGEEGEDDTVWPVNGWWVVEKDQEAREKIKEEERRRQEEYDIKFGPWFSSYLF